VPIVVELAKITVQEPLAFASMPSPLVVTSGPLSSVGAAKLQSRLIACEYAEARASAHWVLQFLDRMKTMVDDQEVQ
jgi:hypothetical protein